MEIEWDPAKDTANREKHGLSFAEASELFTGGTEYLEIYDEEHSGDEERFIAIGTIRRGVVLVVYTDRRDDAIRIISARMANKNEEGLFRQRIGGLR